MSRPGHSTEQPDRGRSEPGRGVYGQVRVIGLAIMLPFVMAAGPVAGYLAGDWIGERLGGVGWTAPVGLLMGAAAGLYQTVLIIRRLLRELK